MTDAFRETRVLVVGGDPLARGGLALLLEREGLTVAGQASPAEAPSLVRSLQLDAVVWDLGAGISGTETVSREGIADLAREETGPAVLALVADEETASDALAAGARGALLRESDIERLAAAAQGVARGLVVLDPGLAGGLLRQPAPAPAELAEPLTPREMEVLQLVAEGLSNPAIGERLGISEHTAKFHVNAILGKLGAQSRADAVLRAVRLGLILF